jgi:D-alanine-D-alanine ligase
MTKVLLLAGGRSDEREVSLRSGLAVKNALQKQGHQVTSWDPVKPLDQLDLGNYEVVFPVLHGAGGEDGSLQAQLESTGIPFVGTGSVASALCFDKWRYKKTLLQNNFPTPKGELVDEASFWQSPLIKHPFVLKPNDGGSSIDNLLMRDASPQIDQALVASLFNKHPRLLLEELIEGDEITLAVLDDQPLPAIEIIPPPSGEFDYENKYNGKTQELCPPLNVSVDTQLKAQTMAIEIHQLVGCRHFSRTDIMVNKKGDLFVLETNTIPGMTDQSLFPKAASVGGWPMEQLVDRLIQLALAA